MRLYRLAVGVAITRWPLSSNQTNKSWQICPPKPVAPSVFEHGWRLGWELRNACGGFFYRIVYWHNLWMMVAGNRWISVAVHWKVSSSLQLWPSLIEKFESSWKSTKFSARDFLVGDSCIDTVTALLFILRTPTTGLTMSLTHFIATSVGSLELKGRKICLLVLFRWH